MAKLHLDSYQGLAVSTAFYPRVHAITYPALGLASEAGEVAGKVKKALRDNGSIYDEATVAALKGELGDVLWYVAVLARDLGLSLEEVAQGNIDKLADRVERGVIGGSGDER